MHPSVKKLLEKYQIPVSDRVCGGVPVLQPVWNGSDLATQWVKTCWDDQGGEEIYSTTNIPLSDHDLLHEIAHWVAAAPEQRDLPEYGLGAIAFQTYHIGEVALPDVVGGEEGCIQEMLCWLLCCYWGTKYQIDPFLSESPGYASSWEDYLITKIDSFLKDECLRSFWTRLFWTALVRFDKMRNQI